jgi:uncharacterized membrane protein YfcA
MDLVALLPIAALLLLAGLLGGLVAGLLGVGGGIILVPVLEAMLGSIGVPAEWRMHMAVATSLSTIIPTAISSSRAHNARDAIDWQLIKRWAPGLLLGGLAGSLLAARASGPLLTGMFGVTALVIAIKMYLPFDHWRIREHLPLGLGGNLISGAIATVSAMLGIGGGMLGVPTMTLLGQPVHRAVGTASLFGLLIGAPATAGYLLARPGVALPGVTIGLVSLLGFALIAPASVLMAPRGAQLAHTLSKRALSQAFALFLFVVAARMFYRTFAP